MVRHTGDDRYRAPEIESIVDAPLFFFGLFDFGTADAGDAWASITAECSRHSGAGFFRMSVSWERIFGLHRG